MAESAQELLNRYESEKIRFYSPCSPKHLAFHSSSKLIRIVFGGNRSGKSYAGLSELLFRACFKKHPFTHEVNPIKGKYRIFVPTFKVEANFLIPLLQEYVPKRLLINKDWNDSYDSRNHILTLSTGTRIDIMSYDQETTGAASVELDGVWMDEECPERLFSETITRLISRKGKCWLTVTPLYNLTWALRYWEKSDDPNVEVFRLSIHDNKYLPEKEKQAIIANWPEHERAAREQGQFLEFSGLIYPELDNYVHLLDERTIDPSFPVVFAMDPHQRKGTYGVWAAITPNDDIICFDELHFKGTAKECVEEIHRKECYHSARTILRVADPAINKQVSGYGSERTTEDEFRDAGMSFSYADNGSGGSNAVHEYLKFDKSKPVDSVNKPRLYFTKNCKELWHDMTHFIWDEWRHGNELRDEKERPKDYLKDFPDCVRYIVAMRPSFHSNDAPVRMYHSMLPKKHKSVFDDLQFPPLKNVYGA